MTYSWRGKQVLVTGCQGLIGAPLVKALLDRGANVTGYDTNLRGLLNDYGIDRKVHLIKDTIVSETRVNAAIVGQDVVFHLAAISGVEQSRNSQSKAFDVNVRGTWVVLQEALNVGKVEAVVIASSNHIYGLQERYPVPESAPLRQLDTYSATKIMCDYAGQAYAHNYGLPVGIVRNTNCFSPYDPHSDHIVPGTILSLLKGEQPIIRSRGLTKKSYLLVDDVVDAYLLVAEYLASGGIKGQAFNVADEPISVKDLVITIMRIMGIVKEPTVLGQANDQADENMDSSLIRGLLGWRPKHSLQEALYLTVEGFKKRHGMVGVRA